MPVSNPPRAAGGPRTAALFFVAYLGGAELGHWLSAEPGHFATFWPNSGLYLAFLLRTPPRRWWAVVTAAAAANLTSDVLLHGQQLPAALGFALANTVEAAVGAVLIRQWLGASAQLDDLRSVLVVFLVAAALSTPLGALVGAATVSVAFGASLPAVWQVWWVADALGVLLTAPLVLSLMDVRAWPRPARLLEAAALLAGLVAGGAVVFTSVPPVAPIVLLLFLLWAAVRLDVPGVAVAAFVLAVVAVRYTVLGHGLFTGTGDLSRRVVAVQLFVAVPALVFYAFAVVLAERRRAEAELELRVRERTAALGAERELLSVTLASIGDAVITTDTAGCVTGLNAVAEGLTGWAAADARGQPLDAVFRILNEATRRPVENPAFRALKEGRIVGLANHTVLIARDGTERPIEDSAAPIRGRDGGVVGCVLVFRDVSARKQMEAAEREAERQVVATLEGISDAFSRFDRDWRITYVNAEAERLTGRPRSELLGRSHWDAFPSAVGTVVEAEYRRAAAERATVEFEHYFEPLGRWFAVKADPTPDGGLAVFFRDVTERRRGAVARQQAEERFRLAADAVNGIIYEYDFATDRVERSRGLYEVAGYHSGEVPPTAAWWADQMHPDDRERLAGVDSGAAPPGPIRTEYRVRHRDGRWLHVEDRAVLVRGADGRPVRMVGCTVDVTARKQAEDGLARERERLGLALYTGGLGVYEWRVGAAEVWWSPETYPVFGVDPAAFRPTPESFIALVHPDDRDALWRKTQACIARREVFEHEYRVVRPDGQVRWVYNRSRVAPDPGGGERITGVVTDVTARKRAEEEVENGRRTLHAVVEQCPFGIYIVDADFRIATMNAGSQERAFANVRPLIGRPFDEAMRVLWPEPVAAEVVRVFRRALATGEPYRSADFVNPRADTGRTEGYEWELHRITLPDGRYGVVCYYFDATRLRQAEQALRDSEAHFRSMADNAPAMLWVTDPAGMCTYISRQWCEFTGTTAEQNLGLGWLACVHPDDVPQAKADFVSANDRRLPLRIDYRLRRRDGEYRWALDAATPRFDGGAFAGYVGCVFDVHDRRMSEEGLRETDRRKDEFLATLAHELRNPLAPVRNGIQIMKLAGAQAEASERARGMIERQVEQLAHLIDDLMDLSRINQGKITLQKARMRLSEALRYAVDTSRPLIDRQRHELVLAVPDEPIFVDADATRLTQVFANLLNNAAKYTDPGGRIRLGVERQGGEAVVRVEDNGVGIPADMLSRVFDMFAQVDRSLEKSQGGLGIGLNIVKRLVEMHGGTVGAASGGHGRGCVFTVRLPTAPAPAAASTGGEPMGKTAPARRRVLVVDDNADGATSLAEMLDLMGNETRTAHDGLEAVAAAGAFRPDVILMDIGMPNLNGFDACRRIREQPWGRAVVMVAQTGWGQDDDKQKAKDAGFDLHMTKPIDPAALEKLLAGASTAG